MNWKFTLIPGLLSWTLNKKSVSLNGRLGPLSRSWGTRGTTTTLDMPGKLFSFRKEERRRKRKRAEQEIEQDSGSLSRLFAIGCLLLVALVNVLRIGYDQLFYDCSESSNPWITLGLMSLVGLIILLGLWSQVKFLRGFLFVVIGGLAAAGMWYGYDQFISSAMNCIAKGA